MRLVSKVFVVAAAMMISASAFAYDCDSDCSDVGGYNYWCGNFRNPKKMCRGHNPIEQGACYAQKEVSCNLWNSCVGALSSGMRPIMEGQFNGGSWAAAVNSGSEGDYTASCVAAGVAAAGAVGLQVGGSWGGVIGGTGGVFVAQRVCEQSHAW